MTTPAPLALLLLPLLPLDDDAASIAPEPPAHRVRYYMLEGEPDMARLLNAVGELSEHAAVVTGPEASPANTRDQFLAIRTDLEVSDRDAEKAVKKGRAKPVPLVWTVARWSLTELPPIPEELAPGTGADQVRGMVLGQHSDLHWFELRGQDLVFFYEPGSIDGEWLMERLESGLAPYVGADFRVEILEERVVWELGEQPDDRDVRSVKRDLERLDSVRAVDVYEQPMRIEFTVVLDQLAASGPPVPFGGPAAADANLVALATGGERRPSFDPSQVLEILADNDLVLAAAQDEQ